MAATSGRTGSDLTVGEPGSVAALLFAEPYRFDFFQAVRILEALGREGTTRAGLGVGGAGPPAAEAVRFRVPSTLSFPPSSLVGLTPPAAGRVPELTVAFFGLIGPSGVLPRHYTERVARLVGDSHAPERYALRDWLDLFHHRLISHFYRAWAKYRLWVTRERATGPGVDPFTTAVQAFVGLATPGLTGRGTVTAPDTGPKPGPARTLATLSDDVTQLFAGHFSRRPRTAAGLEAVVTAYLGLPVRVDPFRGQWLSVDASDRAYTSALGGAALGTGPILGERVWDVQSKFRVRVGPVDRQQFDELLPDPSPTPAGKKFYLLMHLIRLYAGPEFDVEVQFVVRATEVPAAKLPLGTGRGPRLGRNTWLVSMTPERDAGDAAFTVADRPS
ncbi:type VI secretion system baseplate subunit TssG [Limnoglobus roseus]|uniref:Type VI secretion system baseplate subunit TssG n=1 Tax=Limnoglobus roseus TaxID=2598579 RepID=A0A5C1AJS7_9BACT|nr:type VI secretion system baseplate subunit TssG [Limnoglobus roseus]QEL19461.1 type VI secretion system baseplate subunit TssG [Limnoglobus roseus]